MAKRTYLGITSIDFGVSTAGEPMTRHRIPDAFRQKDEWIAEGGDPFQPGHPSYAKLSKPVAHPELLEFIQKIRSIWTYPERPAEETLYQACRDLEQQGWLTSKRLPNAPEIVMFESVL